MNLAFFVNKYVPLTNVCPFILPKASANAHISMGANPNTDDDPQTKITILVPPMVSMTSVDQGNQQDIINLINNTNDKLAQPTTL